MPPLATAGGGRGLSGDHDSQKAGGGDDVPPVLRPIQSWQVAGSCEVAADTRRPLLCLRRLPGVIRTDGCGRLGLVECCVAGGMGPILADRLLAEVAYKVGRAPKYGA